MNSCAMRVLAMFSLDLFLGLTAHAGNSANTTAVLTLADLDEICTLSNLALSPDGKLAAIVVSRPDYSTNRRQKSLVLVDTGTGDQRVVTNGDVSAPAFSPRNNALAWLAPGADGAVQVVAVPLKPLRQDSRILTIATAGASVQQFAWSPDGASIAYLAPEAQLAPIDNSRFDRTFQVADSDYLGTSYLARNSGAPPTRLWVLSGSGSTGRMLSTTRGSVRALAWMPDGRAIAVSTQPGSSDVAARLGTIDLIPVGEGSEKSLVPHAANVAPNGRFSVSAQGVIAYQRFRGEDPWTFGNRVAVIENDQPRELTASLDRDVGDFAWLPDSAGILVKAPDHLRTKLWTVALSGKISPIELGALSVEEVAMSRGSQTVFVGGDPRFPPELYFMPSLSSKPVRLTHFNKLIEQKVLGAASALLWRSDGFDQAGVLTYPPGFSAGRKYPLLVRIHGGPEFSAQLAFNTESQFYAANGWLVFEPNYRGSNDQGEKYEAAVIGDATAGPGRDIRAGVEVVRAIPAVDSARVALTGYSYGGVMTSWLIGHHQDWCAAIAGGVVVDFAQYYDESDTGIWIKTLLGSPHVTRNREKYAEQSPETYLSQATTPTLVLQNVGDPNATVGQAYRLYHALKDNGVKAKFIASDLDGHSPPDPFHERQVLQLTSDWLNENCGAH